MKVIRHQSDDADRVIMAAGHHGKQANLQLEYEEEPGGADMCKAMEKKEKKDRITGMIDYMKDEGKSEEDIIAKVMEKYRVSKEYVLDILKAQAA